MIEAKFPHGGDVFVGADSLCVCVRSTGHWKRLKKLASRSKISPAATRSGRAGATEDSESFRNGGYRDETREFFTVSKSADAECVIWSGREEKERRLLACHQESPNIIKEEHP